MNSPQLLYSCNGQAGPIPRAGCGAPSASTTVQLYM